MAIYVECSDTHKHRERNTGIQRVVRNVVNNLNVCETEVFPVIFDGSAWRVIDGIVSPHVEERTPAVAYRTELLLASKLLWNALRFFLAVLIPFRPWSKFFRNSRHEFGLNFLIFKTMSPLRQLLRRARPQPQASVPSLQIQAGDTLVMLDSSWSDSVWDEVEPLKRQGVKIITVIYDLIPISHGQFCDDGLVKAFRHWFSRAAALSDAFVCISDFVRDCVRAELKKSGRDNVPIEYFYLGSDLDGIAVDATIRPHVAAVCDGNKKFILAVGTIEPRKRYDLIVQAYESYVRSFGPELNLVLVGKIGWKVEQLIDKIRSNPLHDKGLYLFDSLNDAELNSLYEKCAGLVFASDIEGFGLPLVEARQKGVPVIASDIPVFREIADEGVVFFQAGDADSLKNTVKRFFDGKLVSDVKKMTWLSWKESTQQLIDKVREVA